MPKAPPFTAESARQAAKLSALVRRAKAQALKDAAAQAASEPPTAPTATLPSSVIAVPFSTAAEGNGYTARRLARVRGQLDLIDGLIERCRDAQKLDRLAAASSKLSELERVLAGRPTPGAHRPSKAPSRQPSASAVMPE
jgi:hypothetical protein